MWAPWSPHNTDSLCVGSLPSSIAITWETVKKANSWAHFRPTEPETLAQRSTSEVLWVKHAHSGLRTVSPKRVFSTVGPFFAVWHCLCRTVSTPGPHSVVLDSQNPKPPFLNTPQGGKRKYAYYQIFQFHRSPLSVYFTTYIPLYLTPIRTYLYFIYIR